MQDNSRQPDHTASALLPNPPGHSGETTSCPTGFRGPAADQDGDCAHDRPAAEGRRPPTEPTGVQRSGRGRVHKGKAPASESDYAG